MFAIENQHDRFITFVTSKHSLTVFEQTVKQKLLQKSKYKIGQINRRRFPLKFDPLIMNWILFCRQEGYF